MKKPRTASSFQVLGFSVRKAGTLHLEPNTSVNPRQGRGFTLIEMLVSVGILVFIVSIVLANHQRFNSSVLLGALAYDVALSVREAQVYGISVRQSSQGEFSVGYGIHFAAASNNFFLFTDRNRNKKFDTGESVVNTYTLKQGHSILRFCGKTGINEVCSDSASLPLTHLDIVFVRPNPDAWITSSATGGASPYHGEARIVVGSPSGATRTIEVVSSGQISVRNP